MIRVYHVSRTDQLGKDRPERVTVSSAEHKWPNLFVISPAKVDKAIISLYFALYTWMLPRLQGPTFDRLGNSLTLEARLGHSSSYGNF